MLEEVLRLIFRAGGHTRQKRTLGTLIYGSPDTGDPVHASTKYHAPALQLGLKEVKAPSFLESYSLVIDAPSRITSLQRKRWGQRRQEDGARYKVN